MLVFLATASTGCSVRPTLLNIIDFRQDGSTARYHETFKEAYFSFDPLGNLDLVLRRDPLMELSPRPDFAEWVHIQGVWESVPGRTVADRSQINATLRYVILGGGVEQSYAGAGSLFYAHDPRKGKLTGTVEQAVLHPGLTRSAQAPVFARVEVSGVFHATHNPRLTRRIIHDIERAFMMKAAEN